jgi:hypothetical protein
MRKLASIGLLILTTGLCFAKSGKSAAPDAEKMMCEFRLKSFLGSKPQGKKVSAADRKVIANSCTARHRNATGACKDDFEKKMAELRKGGEVTEEGRSKIQTELHPAREACIRKAGDRTASDIETLGQLYLGGKRSEAKAIVDGWVKDGSAAVPTKRK